MEPFSSPRKFIMEDYSSGRKNLLIRSNAIWNEPGSQNIDLTFDGVFYVEMPFRMLHGLEITTPTDSEIAYLTARCGKLANDANYWVFVSQGKRYFVGAVHLNIDYTNFSQGETPFHNNMWSEEKVPSES